MSEVTALLFGGVVVGALFDAYAYYKYKYAERALDLAENKRGGSGGAGGSKDDAKQKTLADELEAEDAAGEGASANEGADEGAGEGAGERGGRKTLAQRLKEVEQERAARSGASKNAGVLASADGAVVFEPSSESRMENGASNAEEESGDSAVVSGGSENGFRDSISALRESISDLNGVLRKKTWRKTSRSGGSASELGDASDGASFKRVGSSGVSGYDSGNYGSGDYGVVSS